jgi:hypothetical protein
MSFIIIYAKFINFTLSLRNCKLLGKDKIKLIVIAILLSSIGITYFMVGKESIIMKYVSGGALAIWLITMFFTNKKPK